MTARRAPTALADAPVVVDASIAVQWFANEPGSANAARLIAGERRLLAPDLMAVEAANAWWKKSRRREMAAADAVQALTHLFGLGVVWLSTSDLAGRALDLALKQGHPIYDCLYAVSAIDHRAELATDDARLRQLAGALGLRLWQPG